jgi:hypothetical protein
MHLTTLLASCFFLLTTHAKPIAIRAGAGGPTPKPIPSTCTLTNPLPISSSNCTIATTVNGYKPTSNFTSVHTLYASYFDLPTPTSELWEQCSQQCYGYGEEGECKSAVLAHDVPTPKGYYGGAGGELMIGCLMFDEYLTSDDFEEAVEGQWSDVRAASLECRLS